MSYLPRRIESRSHVQKPADPYDPATLGPKTKELDVKPKSGSEIVTGYQIDGLIFWDRNGDNRFSWRDGDLVSTDQFKTIRAGSARLRVTLDKLGLKRAWHLKDLWWTAALDHSQHKRQLALAATRASLTATKQNGCQELDELVSDEDAACMRQELKTLEEALGQFSSDLPAATLTAALKRISVITEKLQFKATIDAMGSGQFKDFAVELAKLQQILNLKGLRLPPILVESMKDRARMQACLRDAAVSLSAGHLEWAVSDLKRAKRYAEKIGVELNLRQQVIAIMKKKLIILNGDQLRTLFELLQ